MKVTAQMMRIHHPKRRRRKAKYMRMTKKELAMFSGCASGPSWRERCGEFVDEPAARRGRWRRTGGDREIFPLASLCGEQGEGDDAQAEAEEIHDPGGCALANDGEPDVFVQGIFLADCEVGGVEAGKLIVPLEAGDVDTEGDDQVAGGESRSGMGSSRRAAKV